LSLIEFLACLPICRVATRRQDELLRNDGHHVPNDDLNGDDRVSRLDPIRAILPPVSRDHCRGSESHELSRAFPDRNHDILLPFQSVISSRAHWQSTVLDLAARTPASKPASQQASKQASKPASQTWTRR
jgi:hypothetical protein